jgi:hypothetical protein
MTESVGGEAGSAIIEGVAAIAVAFMLLTLVVQVATAVTARSIAAATVAASARRAALPEADLAQERERLERLITETVPGAHRIRTSVQYHSTFVRARATFRWIPPGPDLKSFVMRVHSDAPFVVAP